MTLEDEFRIILPNCGAHPGVRSVVENEVKNILTNYSLTWRFDVSAGALHVIGRRKYEEMEDIFFIRQVFAARDEMQRNAQMDPSMLKGVAFYSQKLLELTDWMFQNGLLRPIMPH